MSAIEAITMEKAVCIQYQPDELIAALRRDGPRLLREHFVSNPDTDFLIDDAVRGNTFRGFPNQNPSRVFRAWARSRLSFSAIAELGEITTQEQLDELVVRRANDLATYWLKETRHDLTFGPGRKLVNLLHKSLIRDLGVDAKGRERSIPFLHVPHDKYLLAAVRASSASGQFGPPIDIPPIATMGYITSQEQYFEFQSLLRAIALEANVPPICIDLLAWDAAH